MDPLLKDPEHVLEMYEMCQKILADARDTYEICSKLINDRPRSKNGICVVMLREYSQHRTLGNILRLYA